MRFFLKKILWHILRVEAKLVLKKYRPKIVAITGSVGKTSTKDAVFAALSRVAHVRKSDKSYNSEIGLPLTVIGVPNGWNNLLVWTQNILKGFWLIVWPNRYPKWLVLEVGVGKPGDMKRTASWILSDVVIMTAIGETPAHIEFFNSREQLIEEKSGLINTLKPGGLLILNADDETILNMKAKALGRSPATGETKNRILTYGFGPEAEVRGSELSISYNDKKVPDGLVFRLDEKGSSLPVRVEGVFGRNHVYAALAALAVASGLKLNTLEAAQALKNYEVPPGRMRLLEGLGGSLIIDDTYNSSPFACESALKTLGEIGGKRKIAVLGDMLELGKHTVDAHKNIGKVASGIVDTLIVVGPRALHIKEGAIETGMGADKILEFPDSSKAGEFLQTFVHEGDIVLIKGSQGMRMERAVAAILLDQKNKRKLLVRQDPEWLEKK